MTFWDKTNSQPVQQEQPQEIQLDEQAVAALQESPEMDLFEEEEEDFSDIMLDANLRLEQGRLYQMILQTDLFGQTDADPRAVRNVQREIRKVVRERMEVMLGIRQEQQAQETIVSSPFNDLEVTVLKMLASKMSKGATETQEQAPLPPKKDGITQVSGNLRSNNTLTPVGQSRTTAKPLPKTPVKQPVKPAKPKSAISTNESNLKKPIEEMTSEELAAHNKAAEERSTRNRAALPNNLVPHPTAAQLEMMYTASAAQVSVANPTTRFRPYGE